MILNKKVFIIFHQYLHRAKIFIKQMKRYLIYNQYRVKDNDDNSRTSVRLIPRALYFTYFNHYRDKLHARTYLHPSIIRACAQSHLFTIELCVPEIINKRIDLYTPLVYIILPVNNARRLLLLPPCRLSFYCARVRKRNRKVFNRVVVK